MKKVLIALDYDPTAQKVAEVGFSLAKAIKAEVILLHVLTDPIYYASAEYSPIMGFSSYADMFPLQLENAEELKQTSQHFLDKTKHHLGDDSMNTLVLEGDFADSILKAAKDLEVDFIVMGSHSHRWLENILLGSVAEKVLNHSVIPLFIIPTKSNSK